MDHGPEPDSFRTAADQTRTKKNWTSLNRSVDPWSIVKMIRDCKGMLEVREMVRSGESPGVTYSKLERIVRHWKRKIDIGKIKMKWVESGR